jgi:autotransporter-associated beta strand protein
MVINGGTFSTLGGVSQDIIGNGTGFTGILTIDGTSNSGDAHYIGTNLNTDIGLGFGSFGSLSVKNGSATVAELRTNNTTATITLETGGTLAMNKLTYSGGGANNFNINGGTLKARTSSTAFIGTPSNGTTTILVKSLGTIIDTNTFNITIARPILTDAVSLGGGITKNSSGILTLGAVGTTTGPAIVNAGGLSVPAGLTSWQPSSFSHSGNVMNFSVGVFNPSNLATIDTAGAVSFSSPTTVNVTGSQFVVGAIPLIKYGTLSGYSNLTLNTASLPAGVLATLQDNGAGLIYLDVTQGGFIWSGASATPGTGDWDTTSSNWNNFLALYSNPAPVTFPTIIGGGTVTVPADVSPAAVEFTNTTGNDYVLGGIGKITGPAIVSKTGNGKVTLTNTNDYAGNTNINSGILSIATTGALPGWNVNSRYPIASGATLAVQNTVSDANVAAMLATTGNFGAGAILGFDTEAADRTYASNLSGAIGVANVGSNVLTLSGSNSHTGNTLVAAGTLKAGSSTAFTGTGPLVMSASTTFDLGGNDAAFTTINAGASSNSITDGSAGTGTSTLSLLNGGSSFLGAITDGPTRQVALKCRAGNASNVPNNADNTYSGGLTLLGGIDAVTNGTRLIPFSTFTTVDETGVVTSGPYGTGSIKIGEISTDKVQVYFQTAGRTIANNIIVNSAVGTDTAGTFRVESGDNTISGAILANEASAFFRNNTTGGSAGNGAIILTGPISTGSNPASGLTVNAAGVNTLALTLNNQTAVATTYTGNTTITGASTTLILGAASQIPSGSGTGDVVMTASKLDLAGFDETINGLSGSGTVDNVTSGADNTLTLGDGDATGTAFSGVIANTNNTLSLTKTGSGIQTLSGVNTYSGATSIDGGTLALGATGSIDTSSGVTIAAGAKLDTVLKTTYAIPTGKPVTFKLDGSGAGSSGQIDAAGLDITTATVVFSVVSPLNDAAYVLATYGVGTLTGTAFASVTAPSGYTLDYAYNGGTQIALVQSASSPYDTWMTGYPAITGPDMLPTADPDKDGLVNQQEFAYGLIPNSGASVNPVTAQLNKTTGKFTYQRLATSGLAYTIWTSTDLVTWNPDATATAGQVASPAGANQSVEVTLTGAPLTAGKLFVRVKAE